MVTIYRCAGSMTFKRKIFLWCSRIEVLNGYTTLNATESKPIRLLLLFIEEN